MDALTAIHTRRSIRKYTGDPIPKEDLEAIVDAGRMAASGYNRQPWEFIVITETQMIARLSVAAGFMQRAAAVIALIIDPEAPFALQDAAAAVQTMLIAATALGHGSCWLEGTTRRYEEEFKSLLGVPEALRLVTLVSLGVPAEHPTREKKPLSQVLHWEHYGAKHDA